MLGRAKLQLGALELEQMETLKMSPMLKLLELLALLLASWLLLF